MRTNGSYSQLLSVSPESCKRLRWKRNFQWNSQRMPEGNVWLAVYSLSTGLWDKRPVTTDRRGRLLAQHSGIMIVSREDARRRTNYYMHDDDENMAPPAGLLQNVPLHAYMQNYRWVRALFCCIALAHIGFHSDTFEYSCWENSRVMSLTSGVSESFLSFVVIPSFVAIYVSWWSLVILSLKKQCNSKQVFAKIHTVFVKYY